MIFLMFLASTPVESFWDVVRMGRYGSMNLLRLPRSSDRVAVRDALARVELSELRDRPLAALSGGQRKRAFLARAIAQRADVLLLDEPLAGLNSVEAARLADTVADINRQGLTVVMIEHNLGEVLRISQRLVVLDNGRKIADGEPVDVMRDATVRAAYVGKERQHAAA